MTARPPRDVPADATRIITGILRRDGCRIPEAVTAEIIAALGGNHLGLVDLTPPVDPNANPLTPVDPNRIVHPDEHDLYQAAKEQLRKGHTDA